jgi:hypothetical protein
MRRNCQSLLQVALESSSSDDDDELLIGVLEIMYTHYQSIHMPKHGGSVPGHRVICREREFGH